MKQTSEVDTEFRISTAEFESGATDVKKLPAPTLPEVAFAGRSNVGKSSLLNSLVQRRNLVRTSRTPGCTRQINVFAVDVAKRSKVLLVDLPGYGYAKRAKSEKGAWGPMLENYLTHRETLRALVILVDVRRGLEEDDEQLVDFMNGANEKTVVIVVATKLDKLPRSSWKPTLDKLRASSKRRTVIGFSSVTNEGRELLWRQIWEAVSTPAVVSNPEPPSA